MATEVTKIVDPGEGAGHDYHSLSLWEAGEQGDLTGVRDEIAIAKCRATDGIADTTTCTIDGWVTGVSNYITIEAETSHGGKWNDNIYRIQGSIDGVNLVESNVFIKGIQIYQSNPSGTYYGIWFDTALSNINIIKCIIRGNTVGGNYGIMLGSSSDNSSNIRIYNCLIYDQKTCGILVDYSSNSTVFIYNNTLVGPGIGTSTGIIRNSGVVVAVNNIITGWTTAAYGTFTSPTNYNSTDLASMGYTGGGANDRLSQTFTFVYPANGDFHLASNDAGARDYGVSDPGSGLFSDDIDGVARGATWDIGADEYVAAGPTNYPRSLAGALGLGAGTVKRKGVVKRNQAGAI